MPDGLEAARMYKVAHARGESWTQEDAAHAWQHYSARMLSTFMCYASDDEVHKLFAEYMSITDD